jgi:hypothetical protein
MSQYEQSEVLLHAGYHLVTTRTRRILTENAAPGWACGLAVPLTPAGYIRVPPLRMERGSGGEDA